MAMPYMGHNIHNLYYRNTFFAKNVIKKQECTKIFSFVGKSQEISLRSFLFLNLTPIPVLFGY